MSELNYKNLNLGEEVNDILDQDFWLLDHLSLEMFAMMADPIKFSATASIFIRKGHCKADINLINYEIDAPCIVNIRTDNILKPTFISDDFDASFMVLSERLVNSIYLYINDPLVFENTRNAPIQLDEAEVSHLNTLYSQLSEIVKSKDTKYNYQAVLHTILGYLYSHGLNYVAKQKSGLPSNPGRLSERFLQLVRRNFKTQRFLDFYADKLGVTSKHLSRTVKAQTGYTAVEWIERHIILEAQVLLRSSNLHIQQIASELNFPSQSIFGKYFKKQTGLSPREFRNLK